jgi:predicted O-linked N-acetylglucosamine transferase (SPINDLY family)
MGLFDALRGRLAPQAQSGDIERADALIAQGHALEDAGRIDDALRQYEAAAQMAPGHARAHLNIGNAWLAKGDAAAALQAYETALQVRSGYAPAHFNMGNALQGLGRASEAMARYREAVQCDAQFVDAWIALGNTQDDLGQPEAALESYANALRLAPDRAQVLVNLAQVERKLGRLADAERSCRRAIGIDPRLTQAHLALGQLQMELRDPEAALASFRHAVRTGPRSGAARAQAYHCANQLCDWSQRDEDQRELLRLVDAHARDMPPFYALNIEPEAGGTAAFQRQAARRFAEGTLAPLLDTKPLAVARPRPRPQRLRVGYLSSDLHDHATMHLLRGVMASHDRSRFRITAYSYGRVSDDVTLFARQACEEFRDIARLSDADAAALIARDEVDILVDLKGFTRDARLGITACRPAPVLVSWLGYPASLGHARLADWIVGDPVVTPLARAGDFSEALALMPHCYQPNDRSRAIAAAPTRAELGLPENAFVFCSFNQAYKFSPATLDVWCRLLREVPDGLLWLLPSSAPMAAHLRREMAARGVDGERLLLAPSLPIAQHLARLKLADLALDTFPVNSHTTASDALWAGVPLVTRTGETFASRVAASLLHAIGLPELVTADWDGYFSMAKALASDRARLASLRQTLLHNQSTHPLFDTTRFTRDLERLFTRMWQCHEKGQLEHIVLEPEG